MQLLGELRLGCTADNIVSLVYFFQHIGSRLHVRADALLAIELAMRETIRQIVDDAYLGNPDTEFVVRLERDNDLLIIQFVDFGQPFTLDVSRTLSEGITLRLLVDGLEQQSASVPGGPNTIRLTKQLEFSTSELEKTATRELNALESVTSVLNTGISLDDLLLMIINKLVETVEAERGTLFLYDEARQELYSRVLLEDMSLLTEIRVKSGEGIAGHVVATGEIVNLKNAWDDPRFNRHFDEVTGYRTETILAAPMRNPQQKIIGVVELLNKKGGVFTDRDARLLVALTSQATISIENARMYASEIEHILLQKELETAREIQQSFMPEHLQSLPGWDIAAVWEPAKEVAGDFYDLYPLADGRMAFIIADVSGKGVPAALFMALSVTVLRIGMSLGYAPAELLVYANQAISSFNTRSNMFASVFVGYLDPHSHRFCYASGGHNPPLLYRIRKGQCEYLKARGIVLGLFDDASFAEEEVLIEQGDMLVLYTDGITEAMTVANQEFGLERMESVIKSTPSSSANEALQRLMDEVHAFSGARGAFDDETLIILKCFHLV